MTDIVVGAGPNGLAAAATLAEAGRNVVVVEGADEIGGGTRSSELTLPGFVHDVCSAIHPLALASPYLRGLPLGDYGLEWIHPDAPLAHPLDDGSAVMVERSVEDTARGLGEDAGAYRKMMAPLVRDATAIFDPLLAPLRLPRKPLSLARFGLQGLRSADGVALSAFRGPRARALFAGLAAHSMLPLDRSATAAFALLLGSVAHSIGWPFPRGGARSISDALAGYGEQLGVQIETGRMIGDLDDIGPRDGALLDVTPRQFLAIAGSRVPERYGRTLRRYRYGPAAFKVDWALSGPIPWTAAACGRAGTVHAAGSFEDVAHSMAEVAAGRCAERPYVIVTQQSLFDPSRAPAGKQVAWAYCHVPLGSSEDMTDRIEAQIERFAPGFKDLVIGRHVMSPSALEAHNANLVGGDISGGTTSLSQLFTRPAARLSPWRTPLPGVYLCSAATPPGPGVHGMCGHLAARAFLRRSG